MASESSERFGSLFGRDACITSIQLLTHDLKIAEATLEALSRNQGTKFDDLTEEEPGKIPHEVRDHDLDLYIEHGWPVDNGRLVYYGSIDSTIWFVLLAAEVASLGGTVPGQAVSAAVNWITNQGWPVTYNPRNQRAGLAHHWWRDVAHDLQGNGHGMVDNWGRPIAPPVAVSAVTALAWRALVEAQRQLGVDTSDAQHSAIGTFRSNFLVDESRVPLFARYGSRLDHSPTSDLGIILYTGILDRFPGSREATIAMASLPNLLGPLGLRTLPTDHLGFRSDGYHTGAVWPFDNWFASGHLPTQVRVETALRALPEGLFPELIAPSQAAPQTPIIPTSSCKIQAWSLGAVIAWSLGWSGCIWHDDERP